MSGLKCAEWVPDVAAKILRKEFAYWQDALDHWPSTWALPLRVGPPTRDTIADLMRAEERYRAEMQFWQRLANDPAMEKVYKDLDAVGVGEHQLADFLDAAWMANMGDLRAFRERRNHTLEIVPKIGKKALELKEMIEGLDSDLMPPSELFDVLRLLQSAQDDERKSGGWLGRRHIVGEKPSDSLSEPSDAPTEVEIKIVAADPSNPPPERNGLDPYLWEGAPTVPNLLKAMADAAGDWKQKAKQGEITEDANRGNPVLTAALQKDRSLLIPEYARGFIAALRDNGFVVTSQSPMHLTRAIRGIIRVVLGYTEQDTKGKPKHQADAVRMAVSRAIAS